ncbi:hypothetical protein [Streptomyces sp. NPDC047990]|uniref:hypothetical protein n=1 Tax=Streptomyces sp. NPDC047990 TaxID=3365496 RepID=UPI003716154E
MPEYIIQSSHGAAKYRFAEDGKNVRNSLRGLLNRYPNAEVIVWRIDSLSDASADFLLGVSG